MGEVKPACNGKIDVVFVVPNAGDEHFDVAMPSSLPAFAETMTTTLANFDLHVMVLDAGGAWGSWLCPKDKCPADGPCPALADPSFPCWALHDEAALTKCDDTLGAGVTFPAGLWASNVRCPVPEGRRFLISGDANFEEAFTCIGTMGGRKENERGPESLMRMVSADLQHGCNEGFLREDALLLVFLMSAGDNSDYSPPVWANAVLEAKGDDEDKVVVMAVADDRGLEDPLCPGKTYNEPFLAHQFAMRFEHGLLGSLCVSDYGPYFEDAATLAAELCDLGPQG